jgi:hypothetical protein
VRQNDHLAAGESFLALLYSYRSLSRAIPQVGPAPPLMISLSLSVRVRLLLSFSLSVFAQC